jgi:hypothetical protein
MPWNIRATAIEPGVKKLILVLANVKCANVRYWHLADMQVALRDVCFWG